MDRIVASTGISGAGAQEEVIYAEALGLSEGKAPLKSKVLSPFPM